MHARYPYLDPCPAAEQVRLIRARLSVRELVRLANAGGRLSEAEQDRVARFLREQGEVVRKVAEQRAA